MAMRLISADGRWWWNGRSWQPLPQAVDADPNAEPAAAVASAPHPPTGLKEEVPAVDGTPRFMPGRYVKAATPAPGSGIAGRLYALSGGRIKLGPSRAEIRHVRLLDEARTGLPRAVRTSGDQVSAACLQQIEAARTAAAALITEAGVWSAERLTDAATEVSNAIIERLREETAKAQRAGQIALRAAWATAIIGGLAVAATVGFWLATISHG